MHSESLLITIAAVVVLGIGAQWLAWRFRLPSILLLLIFGFVAGPVTGFIDPATLQGDWLFPFVSLAVGIILFEGGLSLRLDELREVGAAVRNLITIGVVVTGVLAALGAHYLVGFGWNVAIVTGAILTVTGPTVVIPLLRHVRPAGRVGTVAKWEGITIDPIGAILAVLVMEAIILVHEPLAPGEVREGVAGKLVEGMLLEVVVGVGVAILGAAFLVLLLRRRLVPDWLQNPIALMTVVATFALANSLQEEAGLLEATLMGIIMANQKYVSVRRIVEFKEDLRVLLISLLFIVLSARLTLDDLAYVSTGALIFLGGLIFVVRPLAVFLSSLGTRLTWKEQAFLSWMAPRGIVAAAVASLFSFRLQPFFPEDAAGLVPIIFLVIVGTVALYGLTISPVARMLGLALPDPQGVLFIGAHPWARRLAEAIHRRGFRVLLVDANPKNVRAARRAGLPAQRANVLADGVIDELDLSGVGQLLALTPNDEVNALGALHFAEAFETADVYQLATRLDSARETDIPVHLRGQPLFSDTSTYADLDSRFQNGATIASVTLTERYHYSTFRGDYDDAMPLFLVRGDKLSVFSGGTDLNPQPDDVIIALFDERPVAPGEGVIIELEDTARRGEEPNEELTESTREPVGAGSASPLPR
ncbi:MAG: sodium:proton antiporter [Rhodothermaceae bacterium]|nr:sodium:proton antiporter [Rhodothermaceae bacterium]